MKKEIIVLGVLLATISVCQGQITEPNGELLFEDTISQSPLGDWIFIPSPNENIWEYGIPSKSFFDGSLSGDKTLITDSTESYPTLVDDYFLLSIPSSEDFYSWPEGILSFYHKYQTDSLFDGGLIEISYDGGESWTNLVDDVNNVESNFIGLYSDTDTIEGGIPAYTGSSDDWNYAEFHWIWVALLKSAIPEIEALPILKFRFISDENDSQKDGWMIDQIVFRGYDYSGGIDRSNHKNIEIYPNPCSDFIYLDFPQDCERVNIYNIDGKLITARESNGIKQIDVSELSPGIYYYVVHDNENNLYSGKLVKE